MVHEYFDANQLEPRHFDPADAPGLYAIGIPRETWAEFALGDAPDAWRGNVWLYVGKSEDSIANRTVKTHFGFGWGCTGRSTFRRTLVALLHQRLDLEVIPRNPLKPGHYDRYGIGEPDERTLGEWIDESVIVAQWPWTGETQPFATLVDAERAVLAAVEPPFNLTNCRTQWTDEIKARRAATAALARESAVSRGLDSTSSP